MTMPKVDDIVTFEGEEYRVLELLSAQFVAECVTKEGSDTFIFYKDRDWKVKT